MIVMRENLYQIKFPLSQSCYFINKNLSWLNLWHDILFSQTEGVTIIPRKAHLEKMVVELSKIPRQDTCQDN